MRKITLSFIFIAVFLGCNCFACEDENKYQGNRICEDEKCIRPLAESNYSDSEISALTGAGHDGEDGPASNGLPSGGEVGPCDCWEPAMPGARQAGSLCKSGTATAVGCANSSCPSGGNQWHFVCD